MLRSVVRLFAAGWLFTLGNAMTLAGIIYSVPAAVYSEGFNSLPTNGNNLPWINDSTVAGWSLFDSQATPVSIYGADDGTNINGSFYSYGMPLDVERSLGAFGNGSSYFGSPPLGSPAGHIAVEIVNTTGMTLNSFFIAYMGEQWRSENILQQSMVLQYGYGPTFAGVNNWTTPGGNFDFNGPVFGPVGIPINGNSQGLIAGLGGTVSNQNWLSGQTLWIRWNVMNELGGSHAFAVDNFQFQATGVPEPSSLCSILTLVVFLSCKRIRTKR